MLDGSGPGSESTGGHNRKEIRIRNKVLLLDNAVVALGREYAGEREPVVKHAEARSDHTFRLPAAARAWRPGETYARREISPVVDIGLRLITQPETEREVRTRPPVVP